jgi:2-polyprenyl-3-methyl-5-hydroxy-6-metoxy-1,4-benzoquinol methylase
MCDEISPGDLIGLQTRIRRDYPQGERQLVLFRRQYLQKLDIKHITFPPRELLQLYDVQRWIYTFVRDPPADEYRPKSDHDILNELVKLIEEAVKDAEEPDVDDTLVELAAELCIQPRLNMTEAAQRDVWVSYEGPWPANMLKNDRSIKLLEKPRLLAATGFTGFRTWEAAIALASYIATEWLPKGKLAGKRVLELGAGTGLISFLCAKEGDVKFVVATDGAQDAIERLEHAGEVNGLQDIGKISYGHYYWGETFEGTVIAETFDAGQVFDIVLGADIVGQNTYAAFHLL